ncbi:high mobility group box domain-containing protein [Myxozyma melibiosi]|uniref:High mobility group box domain-containing protein n=1 Tax=Myxozyma melibiosi TaxID=54550 RepID=A0ABR1FBT8_9ASCO
MQLLPDNSPSAASSDDDHLPHAVHALTSAFNPVISGSPPPSISSSSSPFTSSSASATSTSSASSSSTSSAAASTSSAAASTSPSSHQHPQQSAICLCPQVARVPRPRNAFILYRQHHHASVVADHPGKTNPEISKIIGEQWRHLSPDEKAVWQRLGDVCSAEFFPP